MTQLEVGANPKAALAVEHLEVEFATQGGTVQAVRDVSFRLIVARPWPLLASPVVESRSL